MCCWIRITLLLLLRLLFKENVRELECGGWGRGDVWEFEGGYSGWWWQIKDLKTEDSGRKKVKEMEYVMTVVVVGGGRLLWWWGWELLICGWWIRWGVVGDKERFTGVEYGKGDAGDGGRWNGTEEMKRENRWLGGKGLCYHHRLQVNPTTCEKGTLKSKRELNMRTKIAQK